VGALGRDQVGPPVKGLTDVQRAVAAALRRSPHVRSVRLVGSRSRDAHSSLSDWDLFVETDDIDAVAAELEELVAPLEPLGQLWDPLSEDEGSYYMLVLRGPVKVDLVFDRPNAPRPPWEPSAENLREIDAHFWDWTLWLASKREKGDAALVERMLPLMLRHLLGPLGGRDVPTSIEHAIDLYLPLRERAERRFGVVVPRALGDEVARAVRTVAVPPSSR
jgi:predicted nucleotidyltransferase